MGWLRRVLGYERTERRGAKVANVESDAGGGDVLTAEHYQPSGDDAQPLPKDFAVAVPSAGSGREVVVAFLDPANAGDAGPGERRIYARDSEGVPVCEVWLKSTGEVLVSNDNGSATLRPDGGTIVETPESTLDVAADGSVTVENESGTMVLTSSGDVEVSENLIVEGEIKAGGDVIADKDSTAISLLQHTHIGNLGSSTSPPEP